MASGFIAHATPRTSSRAPRAVLTSLAGIAAAPAFLAAGWAIDGTVPHAAVGVAGASALRVPATLVIRYGHPLDPSIFEAHYQTTHVSLAHALPHCTSLESAMLEGDASGRSPAFHRSATLTFATVADLLTCLSSRAGQAVLKDIASFATGGATATIAKDIQPFQGPLADPNR